MTLAAATLNSKSAGSSACKAKLPADVLGFVVELAWLAVDAASRPRKVLFFTELVPRREKNDERTKNNHTIGVPPSFRHRKGGGFTGHRFSRWSSGR